VAKEVSSKLGNTPVVALQAYIDPRVFSDWRKEVDA
jgi:DNA topoisomerase IB